jgi:GH15 family glucan-1,4-alpha-glucosidase
MEEVDAKGSASAAAPVPVGWPSLYDYGLIGNQRTAALVSRHGSIDWACFPRFDSPSVFARLLDRRIGGYHRVAPDEPYVSHQQYIVGTNVLTTFFEIRRRVALTVTDFMPIGRPEGSAGGETRIVRQLAARGHPIPVSIRAEPRFEYGTIPASWAVRAEAAVAEGSSGRLSLTSPWDWSTDGGVAISAGVVEPGAAVYTQVCWGDPPGPDPSPGHLLSGTDAFWRAWASPPDAPLRRVAARWHPWVERSELVLSLLSPADTGVFVAAPTTSLPEWPGGGRNWDYRYVWLRDAAFTAQVFLLLGHVREARAYVDWAVARATALGEGKDLATLYTVDGQSPPGERELSHLEGYLESRPVRVGNAAADQLQLDVYGEILDSAALLERADPAFVRARWEPLRRLADRTTELWTRPDSGIWEFRTPPAHYVHSKLMCWVALDRAIQLAEAFGQGEAAEGWRPIAEAIRSEILTRGFDERLGSFIQAFDRPVLDACALRIPIVGFLPPSDPRVVSTIAAVEGALDHHGLLRRYEGEDGLAGPEGAFLLCSFWHVEALARCGQMERALTRWRGLLEVAGPLLLFSEEFDPLGSRPLGNYPQAFTHIGVLRAALALGLVGSDH